MRMEILKVIPFFIFLFLNSGDNAAEGSPLVLHKPSEILITTTSGSASNPTPFTGEIVRVASDASVKLGAFNTVKFIYIDTQDSKTITDAFDKYETTGTSTDVQIKLKTDVTKSIVFKVSDSYKILVVGAKDEDSLKNYLITKIEKDNQFVHLTHIKCIATNEVKAYHTRTSTTPTKPYVTGLNHLCFIASMLTAPTCIEVSDSKKSYTMIISPFPQPEQKCPTTSKPCDSAKLTTQSPNATESAKQSATPIIISVVVIVIVIIGGGVGYVLMKK